MATALEISAFAADRRTAERAIEAAFAEVARVESALSSWQDDSALSALNRAAGAAAAPCDPLLLDFLTRCVAWAQTTGGAVDVTCGPLTSLWRRAAETGQWPPAAAIARARDLVGTDGLVIDSTAGTAGLLRPGSALDAGGIGKGYALDCAAEVLGAHGVTAALLDFGGQLLATGPRPDGSPWPVLLRDASGDPTGSVLALARGSIATTADYERRRHIGKRRASHVIDPRTGEPVAGMRATSVHAASATEADALSTALFVMGFDAASEWAQRHGTAALIRGAGRTVSTGAFDELYSTEASPR